MNETQKQILELANHKDINALGIRELARQLGVHPQTAKYHREQLIKKGLIRRTGTFRASRVEQNMLDGADLVTIPYLGAANCGPAARFAGAEPAGQLGISSRLLHTKKFSSLFAIKADGNSMNRARLYGETIEDGDFVIVDSEAQPKNNDYVVSTVNNLANIKKYAPEFGSDGTLQRITLLSESTDEYEPIFIHPEDEAERLIAGVAVQVIKKPLT
ncbi:MAG: S24 family peptidase [Patescibacteria group bacterium]